MSEIIPKCGVCGAQGARVKGVPTTGSTFTAPFG